jgi:hypothetical protein
METIQIDTENLIYYIIIMETQTKESMQQELAELEADLDTALEKYRELKEKIQACTDQESDEYFGLSLAEFNLFNYMDMLDEDIHELREKLAAL